MGVYSPPLAAGKFIFRFARNDKLSGLFTKPPIYDIEHCVLTGKVVERQKDKMTAEWKYRVNGQMVEGSEVEVIAKLSPTGKLVIITVYLP